MIAVVMMAHDNPRDNIFHSALPEPLTLEEEEEEIQPYVHSATLAYEDKSMFMFSPNGPA